MGKAGHTPQRTCMGCRQAVGQQELVRYVMAPDGEVLIDYGRKLPGRGAYTHLDRTCLETALRTRQFERAFRGKNRRPEPDALLAALKSQIRGRIVNLLGMARKAGQAVAGTQMVIDRLGRTPAPALVLLAADVAPGMEERVRGKAAAAGIGLYRMFDKDLLGRVLGKGERGAVAIEQGPLAVTIQTELLRLKNVSGES